MPICVSFSRAAKWRLPISSGCSRETSSSDFITQYDTRDIDFPCPNNQNAFDIFLLALFLHLDTNFVNSEPSTVINKRFIALLFSARKRSWWEKSSWWITVANQLGGVCLKGEDDCECKNIHCYPTLLHNLTPGNRWHRKYVRRRIKSNEDIENPEKNVLAGKHWDLYSSILKSGVFICGSGIGSFHSLNSNSISILSFWRTILFDSVLIVVHSIRNHLLHFHLHLLLFFLCSNPRFSPERQVTDSSKTLFHILIIVIFKRQRYNWEPNSSKNDNEDATNVLNGNAIAFIRRIRAIHFVWVICPPFLFQSFQTSLVQQHQNSKENEWVR